MSDQQLLAKAKEHLKECNFLTESLSALAGTYKIYYLGRIQLQDGRVIRVDEMGDCYFAED